MDAKELIEKRKELLNRIEDVKKQVNIEYNNLVEKYAEENIPVNVGKVYELKTEKPPRGFSRFVVYELTPTFFQNKHVIFTASGWWLDKNDTPKRWKSYVVFGSGNPVEFILSKNQSNNNHPDSNTTTPLP